MSKEAKQKSIEIAERLIKSENAGYFTLFKFFSEEHDLLLLDSEIQEIIHQVNSFQAAPLPNERTAQWVSDLKDMPNEYYAKFYGWIDETEVKFGMLKYLNKKYYRAVGHGFSFDIDKSRVIAYLDESPTPQTVNTIK